MTKTKQKKLKIGDTLKLTQSPWGFDVYDGTDDYANGTTVYTLKVEKIEKIKLILE